MDSFNCQLDTIQHHLGRESQVMDCPHLVGLWVCLLEIDSLS